MGQQTEKSEVQASRLRGLAPQRGPGSWAWLSSVRRGCTHLLALGTPHVQCLVQPSGDPLHGHPVPTRPSCPRTSSLGELDPPSPLPPSGTFSAAGSGHPAPGAPVWFLTRPLMVTPKRVGSLPRH